LDSTEKSLLEIYVAAALESAQRKLKNEYIYGHTVKD
jgi:hypothetical protein